MNIKFQTFFIALIAIVVSGCEQKVPIGPEIDPIITSYLIYQGELRNIKSSFLEVSTPDSSAAVFEVDCYTEVYSKKPYGVNPAVKINCRRAIVPDFIYRGDRITELLIFESVSILDPVSKKYVCLKETDISDDDIIKCIIDSSENGVYRYFILDLRIFAKDVDVSLNYSGDFELGDAIS